ncbi:hypothetical protein EK21DRAFT_89639 [Setomelanomma holmii]|uniref:Uncharacterized protein n=1 Tax=Setomelanomma holmii TaxID=210430 RepID=A0A9P4H9A3_9PLEO|nr:hypothetical protein EK21DRAFT_89639 [Setomelanomma holmii]
MTPQPPTNDEQPKSRTTIRSRQLPHLELVTQSTKGSIDTLNPSSPAPVARTVDVQMIEADPMSLRSILNPDSGHNSPNTFAIAFQDSNKLITRNSSPSNSSVTRSAVTPPHATDMPSNQMPHGRDMMDEEEELAELEDMMVPASIQQARRDGVVLPINPLPPLAGIKVSKFTTTVVTEAGFLLINNAVWRKVSEGYLPNWDTAVASATEHQAMASTGYDDLPGKLVKQKAVDQAIMEKSKLDAAIMHFSGDTEVSLNDPKYVDIDNYMAHAQKSWPMSERRVQHNASTSRTDEGRLVDRDDASEEETPPGIYMEVSALQSRDELISNAHKRNLNSNAVSEDVVMSDMNGSHSHNDTQDGDTSAAFLPTHNSLDPALKRGRSRSKSPSRAPKKARVAATDETVQFEVSELVGDQKGKWDLVDGSAEPPRVGQATPEKLTIRIRNKETEEIETHVFQVISPHFFDWNNKAHVQEVAKWRSQVFQRRGFVLKRVMNMWSPEETAWMVLLHQKIKGTIEAGNIVKLVGPAFLVDAYNAFWEGKVLQDSDSEDLPAREAHDDVSVKAKLLTDGIKPMRDTMRKLLESKSSGHVYVPKITEDELNQSRENGTVVIDDAAELFRNAVQPRRASPKRV